MSMCRCGHTRGSHILGKCWGCTGPDCNPPAQEQDSLADFLLARIAEDEAEQREGETEWHLRGCGWNLGEGLTRVCGCGLPARVLAECEAKRRIVAHLRFYTLTDQERRARPDDPTERLADDISAESLRLLALPYADHPDYQPEWRP